MELIFFIVLMVAFAVGIGMSLVTRGIVSEGQASDADRQILAAAHSKEWRWPSDMHKYAGGKAWMKDIGVLGLACMQRILKDYRSFHPVVVLCAVANAIVAVLVYEVASGYWGWEIGIVIFALYVISVWPYQTVLQGGYQVFGSLFFLLAVYCLQHAPLPPQFLWYFFSGVGLGAMMFSSASSRKFLPLFIIAFFYTQRDVFSPLFITPGAWRTFMGDFGLWLMSVYALIISAGLAMVIFLRQGVFFRSLKSKENVQRFFIVNIIYLTIYFFIAIMFSQAPSFYWAQFLILTGALLVSFALMYPRIMDGLKGFYSYWTISEWKPHLVLWSDYFTAIGKQLKKSDVNGSGFRWYPKFFWRMIPFHFLYYLIAVLSVLVLMSMRQIAFHQAVLAVVVSILPVLYAQITGGPQFARTHFPTFFGLLFLLGYTMFQVTRITPPAFLFWVMSGSAIVVGVVWNFLVLWNDIIPARMATARILRTFQLLGVHEFYTYDSPYNNAFLFAIPESSLQDYSIHYIKTIQTVQDGYIFIPPTSAKAINMESEQYAIRHGDFREDLLLDQLIVSHDIVKYAVARFTTVATSRMWAQESEVTSYRDLIIHEITQEDRWRGYAWILDGKKLHEAFSQKVEA